MPEKITIHPVIKYIEETNALTKKQTKGDIVSGQSKALIAAAMPEILNDTRLFAKQESWFERQRKMDHRTQGLLAAGIAKTPEQLRILADLLNPLTRSYIQQILDNKAFFDGVGQNLSSIKDSIPALIDITKGMRNSADLMYKRDIKNNKEQDKYNKMFVKAYLGDKNVVLERMKDMRDFFSKVVKNIGSSIKNSFERFTKAMNFGGFINSVGKWLIASALFFYAISKSGTFANMIWGLLGGGKETTGIWEYIEKNFAVLLFGGLVLNFNRIKMALFGPKGFFGLFFKYISNLTGGFAGIIRNGIRHMRSLKLITGTLWKIFKKLIAIPYMIFETIWGFLKGYQDEITAGGGFMMAIGMGLIGAFKGLFLAIVDLIIAIPSLIIEYITGWSLSDFLAGRFKSGSERITTGEMFSKLWHGDKTPTITPGDLTPNAAAGGRGGGNSYNSVASSHTTLANNTYSGLINIEDLHNRRYGVGL